MNIRLLPLSRTALLAAWLAMPLAAGAAGPMVSHVEVNYTPVGDSAPAVDDARVNSLKGWLARDGAGLLPPGFSLYVTFTKVEFAARTEPWRGGGQGDVPVVRDLYPPRVALHFVMRDPSGRVVSQGDRDLRDLNFQQAVVDSNDPLRYEKHLLDGWVRHEFSLPAQ